MRAVLFDVDGVLVHSRFHPDTTRRRFWDEHLLTDMGIAPEKFQDLFGPDFSEILAGRKSLVEALDAFLPSVGYKGSTLDFVAYWMERDCHVNYPLVELIKRLRRQADVRVFLATNQEHLRANYLWHTLRLGHIFDDMFYAARFGVAKPDPQFFDHAERLMPDGDDRPLFFDDSRKCVDSASSSGWEGVLFTEIEHFTRHPWVVECFG